MYEEKAPPRRLRGVARCVWRSASEGPKRIVPDGCVDLVRGGGAVFVAGPDTAAWSSVTRPGEVLSGVRLVPGLAATVLGVAADEVRDRRVPLEELWGRCWAERLAEGSLAGALAERLAEAAPPDAADAAVAELIARLDEGVARVGNAAAGLIRAGVGEAGAGGAGFGGATSGGAPSGRATSIEAASLGTSPADLFAARAEDPPLRAAVGERRLRRRFVQAVGYGPATYLRVSRFQRAVALSSRAPNLAALAVAAGYSDQAHLSRECRALTGLTPRAYFR
ncbi:Helix-turn-helix domain-containing protein [Amycolatopsis tolypomycina]|uniref:Helix-turn-helix domain-containing protein n=1 Tax=Amycolatopsis tolypomycina TaxID=208445 RepID=A0A1H4YSY5_9PSEU|nr:helix-turn-helix domain-containing protein [Amycolatopsis tolypomycina]SED20274.1 Helix-turn-helix domain-containing protein [Amycolatopsis tolypomycina]